jgi:hypothetical protein
MSKTSTIRTLSYDFINQSWYLQGNSTKRIQERTVYWGARQVPLPIRLGVSSFPTNRKIRMRSIIQFQNNKPILGPLIGILTVKGKRPPFAGMRANFIDIIATGERMGAIVFVFTPDEINWETETVNGYLYHTKQNSWKKSTFPLPNVVYNRIPNRKHEKMKSVQSSILKLQRTTGLSLFNPQFFNKQVLFTMLEKTSIARQLPETKVLESKKDIKEMLDLHSEIYLKPTQGKAGAGILKVRKSNSARAYILHFQQITQPLLFRSLNELWGEIKKHLISSPYIVQQAIPLATYENRPYDVRTLVQKNGIGQWEISGIGIRVAGANRITTHVPRGGKIESPRHVLKHSFSEDKAAQIEAKIKQMAINIAKELERNYILLGEMSMDIGVDSKGEIWFFEANAKPMKFDEPDIRKRSLDNLIGYSQYLAFNRAKREEKHRHAVAQSFI